ncbi:RNA-binding S4 domain-containing protein [Thalassotalea crassostreae]|uniref:RNA-binding S4 domain-containing protein n=1 Tax=Thalassotalea crassostreae TaxID=1763536 RepID=UPI00083827EF|nr:RNA-binding S4 domain-containing protein [Thalassotalea crassostreae]
MEIEVLAIEINEEPIELYKLLKIANLVGGGGEAKVVISEGYVFLNGEVETQKRKKVYVEDIVQFNGEAIMPVLSYDDIEGDAIEQQTSDDKSDFDAAEEIADETELAPQFETASHFTAQKHQSNTQKKSNSSAKSKKNNKKNDKKNKPKKTKADSDKEKPRSGRRSISF